MKGLVTIYALIGTVIAPALAFASESSHGEHHTPGLSDLTYPFINFLIYLVIVLFAVKKFLPKVLQTRAENIRKGVEAGRSALLSAEKELASARTVFTTFDEHGSSIRAQIAKDAENESVLIKSNAQARAKAIAAQARATAAAEQRSTETVLREEIAELIIRLAEEKIRRELTPENDRVLRERALQGVGVLRG